ncbi:hypothetical protein RND81_10G024300 [Saponaria officinalis]|uniref:RNase H type-1 domain-containing protein n=1 Tax=Saponaria officinalis TaxID=3572 RepID=A0AAW1HXI6_SAPOF
MSCPLCGARRENSVHMARECLIVDEFWAEIDMDVQLEVDFNLARDLVEARWRDMGESEAIKLIVGCWLWDICNKKSCLWSFVSRKFNKIAHTLAHIPSWVTGRRVGDYGSISFLITLMIL